MTATRVLLANRVLWALCVATAAATAIWVAVEYVRLSSAPAAIAVPRVSVAAVPDPKVVAPPPAANPFDPAGIPWVPTAVVKPAASTLTGVIVLPGYRGVMTPSGFVAVGEAFAGGRLVRVGRDRVMVLEAGVEKAIPVGEDYSTLLADWLPSRKPPGASSKGRP